MIVFVKIINYLIIWEILPFFLDVFSCQNKIFFYKLPILGHAVVNAKSQCTSAVRLMWQREMYEWEVNQGLFFDCIDSPVTLLIVWIGLTQMLNFSQFSEPRQQFVSHATVQSSFLRAEASSFQNWCACLWYQKLSIFGSLESQWTLRGWAIFKLDTMLAMLPSMQESHE